MKLHISMFFNFIYMYLYEQVNWNIHKFSQQITDLFQMAITFWFLNIDMIFWFCLRGYGWKLSEINKYFDILSIQVLIQASKNRQFQKEFILQRVISPDSHIIPEPKICHLKGMDQYYISPEAMPPVFTCFGAIFTSFGLILVKFKFTQFSFVTFFQKLCHVNLTIVNKIFILQVLAKKELNLF